MLAAEMYDQSGKKVREFHASGLKKVNGIYRGAASGDDFSAGKYSNSSDD